MVPMYTVLVVPLYSHLCGCLELLEFNKAGITNKILKEFHHGERVIEFTVLAYKLT